MQDNYRRALHTAEVNTDSIRLEQLDGRDHLVAPTVAVKEMVLKGEFLPAEEIQSSEPAWNGRVLPIGHPTDDEGNFASANSPEVHDSQTVGRFFEADASDGSLTGELWVDVESSKRLATEHEDDRYTKPIAVLASHAAEIDTANVLGDLPAAINADEIDETDVLEVSTAYFYRPQEAMGTHDGETYEATQHDIRPDHLALLPNSVGECSAEDGCGAPRMHVHASVDDDADDGSGQDMAGYDPGATEASLNTSVANDTMTETIEWLASHTEFDQETLEGFDEGHLDTLRESVNADCGCGSHDGDEAQNDGDGDADEGADVPDEIINEMADLRDEVEALRDEREAEEAERATEAAETIAETANQFDDTEDVFEALGEDADTLETLAAEFEAQTAGADFGGRVGANGSPGGTDEASDYVDLASEANAARFGGAEESD